MNIGHSNHSELAIGQHPEHYIAGSQPYPEFVNSLGFNKELSEISLRWSIAFFCEENEDPLLTFELVTYCEIISVTDYDTDLPTAKLFVLESYEKFIEEIKRNASAPMVDIKIEEIALKLLGMLTDEGYY